MAESHGSWGLQACFRWPIFPPISIPPKGGYIDMWCVRVGWGWWWLWKFKIYSKLDSINLVDMPS